MVTAWYASSSLVEWFSKIARVVVPRPTMKRPSCQDERPFFSLRCSSGRSSCGDRLRPTYGRFDRLLGRRHGSVLIGPGEGPRWVIKGVRPSGSARRKRAPVQSTMRPHRATRARVRGTRGDPKKGCGGAFFRTTLGGSQRGWAPRGPRSRRAHPQPSVQGSPVRARGAAGIRSWGPPWKGWLASPRRERGGCRSGSRRRASGRPPP